MSIESGPLNVRTAASPRAVGTSDRDVSSPVTQACWLSVDTLLLITSCFGQADGGVTVRATCAKTTLALAALCLPLPTLTRGEPPSSDGSSAVLIHLPAGHSASDDLRVVLRCSTRSLELKADDLRSATVSLDTMLRFELAALESSARADILAFLVAGPGEPPPQRRPSRRADAACCAKATRDPSPVSQQRLSKSLHTARQALRERLPAGIISPSVPQGLNVDAVLALDDRHFYAQGWLHDEEATPTRLTAVSPEGGRTEILASLYLYRRPDVEQFYEDSAEAGTALSHGWIAHLETSSPSRLGIGWIFEMVNSAGSELEVSAPQVTRDPVNVRGRILGDMQHERLPTDRLRAEHIAPALNRLEDRRRSAAKVDSIDQHGTPPETPDVSIVVPLYGRIDFVEHQLAQFVHDPELQSVDLMYVLDSPELAEPFRITAAQLSLLYNVPFRAVALTHNAGFSGVNNLGADLARGRLLLLLNSDVFPAQPGWLSAMTAFYDSTPGMGALAPKLLYEDHSIQHAGMYFRRLVDTRVWANEHYYKGMQRNLAAANITRTVPAVSAACMLIDRALYKAIGGLRGMYVQGDYEDSDLCLRLSQMGRASWYLPTVELYHLEGQSYPSETRRLTAAYNRWLHTAEWGDYIQEVMLGNGLLTP